MVKELSAVALVKSRISDANQALIPHQIDPDSIVNEGPVTAQNTQSLQPKVYEGISRVAVRIPRYEGPALLDFLAACKDANNPDLSPSKLAIDALKNGHGYQVLDPELFQVPFERELAQFADYKAYPNAIIAYGVKDSVMRLIDSDNLQNSTELVQSSRALVLQNEMQNKVLDVLIILFDDQPVLTAESQVDTAPVNVTDSNEITTAQSDWANNLLASIKK